MSDHKDVDRFLTEDGIDTDREQEIGQQIGRAHV